MLTVSLSDIASAAGMRSRDIESYITSTVHHSQTEEQRENSKLKTISYREMQDRLYRLNSIRKQQQAQGR